MIQSKEYIIHQIANDIKTHIGQKYKDKSNIDWGLYTGLLGLIVFCFIMQNGHAKNQRFNTQIYV